MAQNKLTQHHIVPRSQWWSDNEVNIKMLKRNKHSALHLLFENDTPRDQIIRLLYSINGSALNKEFQNDIMKILQESDDWYYYKNWVLLKNYITYK